LYSIAMWNNILLGWLGKPPPTIVFGLCGTGGRAGLRGTSEECNDNIFTESRLFLS
jgi:hypothetical protein